MVLKLSCSYVTRVPSLARTAPIMPTLLRTYHRVFFSGENHAASWEPCCWKWHSSMNHISICSSPARPSCFICLLGLLVQLGNHWTGFSPAKAHLMKKILALPNLKFNMKLFLQVMTRVDDSRVCRPTDSAYIRIPEGNSASLAPEWPCHPAKDCDSFQSAWDHASHRSQLHYNA